MPLAHRQSRRGTKDQQGVSTPGQCPLGATETSEVVPTARTPESPGAAPWPQPARVRAPSRMLAAISRRRRRGALKSCAVGDCVPAAERPIVGDTKPTSWRNQIWFCLGDWSAMIAACADRKRWVVSVACTLCSLVGRQASLSRSAWPSKGSHRHLQSMGRRVVAHILAVGGSLPGQATWRRHSRETTHRRMSDERGMPRRGPWRLGSNFYAQHKQTRLKSVSTKAVRVQKSSALSH